MGDKLICIICPQRVDGNKCIKFNRTINSSADIPHMCDKSFIRDKHNIINNGKRFRTLL